MAQYRRHENRKQFHPKWPIFFAVIDGMDCWEWSRKNAERLMQEFPQKQDIIRIDPEIENARNDWFREQWLKNKNKETLNINLEHDSNSPFISYANFLKTQELKRWFNERAMAYGPDINNWPVEERPYLCDPG